MITAVLREKSEDFGTFPTLSDCYPQADENVNEYVRAMETEIVDSTGDAVHPVTINQNLDAAETSALLDASLPESYRSVSVVGTSFWQKLLSFSGPGALVCVGYMDPGNWSTDIAGGSAYNYSLLCVILFSSLIAIFLQALAAKLGIVVGRDLAQLCRDRFSFKYSFGLWLVMEVAIAATDLAELIGSAVALNLLFGLPIIAGVCITAFDVVFILFFQRGNIRLVEVMIILLVSLIALCFFIELVYCNPVLKDVATGFIPTSQLFTDSNMLFVGISIIGATVMPHNLFLHSSLVLTRDSRPDQEGKKEHIRYAIIDSCIALTGAFFVNASILIVAATTFYSNGFEVDDIGSAYMLLDPVLGGSGASILFGIALLASGQSSTFTGTFAGQVVMEGFIQLKIPMTLRRIITRGLAVVPALVCVAVMGDKAVNQLLIISQVVLCFALPFAVLPLVYLSSDPDIMGVFVNNLGVKVLAYLIFAMITVLNSYLVVVSFLY